MPYKCFQSIPGEVHQIHRGGVICLFTCLAIDALKLCTEAKSLKLAALLITSVLIDVFPIK